MPRYTFLKSIVFRSIFRGFLRGLSPQNPEGIAPRERSPLARRRLLKHLNAEILVPKAFATLK